MRNTLLTGLAIAALAACGDDRVAQPAAAATEQAATVDTAAAAAQPAPATKAEVPDALNFSAPLVGGGTINMADYAGKPVLLWFWAPT